MRTTFRYIFLAGLTASLAPITAAAQTPHFVFDNWNVLTHEASGEKLCYATTTPVSKSTNPDAHNAFLLVTHRKDHLDEVSVSSGYEYLPSSTVLVQVDEQTFELLPSGKRAWNRMPNQDVALIAAIQKGSKLSILGTKTEGSLTTDTYSLNGSSKAINAAIQLCSGKPMPKAEEVKTPKPVTAEPVKEVKPEPIPQKPAEKSPEPKQPKAVEKAQKQKPEPVLTPAVEEKAPELEEPKQEPTPTPTVEKKAPEPIIQKAQEEVKAKIKKPTPPQQYLTTPVAKAVDPAMEPAVEAKIEPVVESAIKVPAEIQEETLSDVIEQAKDIAAPAITTEVGKTKKTPKLETPTEPVKETRVEPAPKEVPKPEAKHQEAVTKTPATLAPKKQRTVAKTPEPIARFENKRQETPRQKTMAEVLEKVMEEEKENPTPQENSPAKMAEPEEKPKPTPEPKTEEKKPEPIIKEKPIKAPTIEPTPEPIAKAIEKPVKEIVAAPAKEKTQPDAAQEAPAKNTILEGGSESSWLSKLFSGKKKVVESTEITETTAEDPAAHIPTFLKDTPLQKVAPKAKPKNRPAALIIPRVKPEFFKPRAKPIIVKPKTKPKHIPKP